MPVEEPFRHERELAGERRAIVRRQLRGSRRAAELDLRQRLQGIAVQPLRIPGRIELRQIVRPAQVLEQHESLGRVGLVHVRDVDSERLEHRRYAQVRPHVLRRRRSVHDDEGAVIAHHAEVPSEAGIARGRLEPYGAQAQIARQPTLQERESRIVLRHGPL